MPRMAIGAPKGWWCRTAGGVAHVGQHASGDVEQGQQFVVPLAAVDVEQQGAGGVGGVGCVDGAFGQAPEQEAVDGAERQVACFGGGAGAVDGIEQPGDLGGGEIRVQAQSGAGGDQIAVAGLIQALAQGGGAAVLPDDGVVDGSAGSAVPEDDRLALVGDAEGGDAGAGGEAGVDESLAGGGQDSGPDFFRVVLYPAGAGVDLGEFLLG